MPDLKAGAVHTVCSVFRYETWSLNILQLCSHEGLLLTHRLLYGAIVLQKFKALASFLQAKERKNFRKKSGIVHK